MSLIPSAFVVGKPFFSNSALLKNTAYSAVLSKRQDLHAGETVVVLGQHHRVTVQTDFTQAWSQVVGVIGLTEGVDVDFSDVVVLKEKKRRDLGTNNNNNHNVIITSPSHAEAGIKTAKCVVWLFQCSLTSYICLQGITILTMVEAFWAPMVSGIF